MKRRRTFNSSLLTTILSAVGAIIIGLFIGYLLLLITKPDRAWWGLQRILTIGFSDPNKFAKVLYQAMPLICTGLSVAFAFKTGLFNIGATGQYTVGTFFGLFAGIQWQLPWYLALIAAMIGGAIWGAIPGICKALFNVNEVITSIMFNWIAVFAVNMAFLNFPMLVVDFWGKSSIGDRTPVLADANASAVLPKLGLDELMNSSLVNIGIFLAIIVAVIIWVLLQKTTFGYEIKACGYNRDASQYAGINAKRNIIYSFMISGALAGLGGGLYYLSGTGQYTFLKVLLPAGFNGIPVALLANSHPIGVIVSALFISYIQVGGDALQPRFVRENIDIIIGVIIYVSAFALVLKLWFEKLFVKRSMSAVSLRDDDAELPPPDEPKGKDGDNV
ncbi:MAG TPA: ABC transporter permease [Candidatus Limiplasma sp.]|nr:ABC transporter permease [Candidatus Limiplasma sp.]